VSAKRQFHTASQVRSSH